VKALLLLWLIMVAVACAALLFWLLGFRPVVAS